MTSGVGLHLHSNDLLVCPQVLHVSAHPHPLSLSRLIGKKEGAHGLGQTCCRGRRFRGAPGLGHHPRRRGRRFRGAPGLGHHPRRRGRGSRPWPGQTHRKFSQINFRVGKYFFGWA